MKEGTDDTPHGIGIKVTYGGSIHEGYWKDGKLNGRGRRIFNCGGYYIGEWERDNYNGEGTMYESNGDIRYEGGWKKNDYYGQGTLYQDGNKYTGIWDNSYDGQGEINYKDGEKYIGQWGDYLQDGLGTLYSADGQVLSQGKWELGEYDDEE